MLLPLQELSVQPDGLGWPQEGQGNFGRLLAELPSLSTGKAKPSILLRTHGGC